MKRKSFITIILSAIVILFLALNFQNTNAQDLQTETFDANLYQEGKYPEGSEIISHEYFAGENYSNAKKAIVEGLRNVKENIDISQYNIPREQLVGLYEEAINDNPDLFYVAGSYSASMSSGIVIQVMPVYIAESSELSQMKRDFETAGAALINSIDTSINAEATLLQAHDQLITHCKYKETEIANIHHSAYGAIVLGEAVCDGYSLAYRYLLSEVSDIETYIVSSEAMNHAWNQVKLNGSYYHVDVTWDDPIMASQDSAYNVGHKFFLCSDNYFTTLEGAEHYGWADNGIYCLNTKYDESILKSAQGICSIKDKKAYVASRLDSKIHKYDFSSSTAQVIEGTKDVFSAVVIDNVIYYNEFPYTTYYNTNNIYSCDLNGQNKKTAKTYTEAVYGLGLEGNELYYCSGITKYPTGIKRTPAETSKPEDTTKPTEEATKPAETTKPTESTKPAETTKPTESTKPAETTKPTENTKPTESTKPTETTKPTDTTKPALQKITLNCADVNLKVGSKFKLDIKPYPENAVCNSVEISIDNQAVAQLLYGTTIKAAAPGKATVTVKCGSYTTYCTVTVTPSYYDEGVGFYKGVDYRSVYNQEYYYANNPDLQEVFGYDGNALIAHFVNFGMAEGRCASVDFDVNAYRGLYDDLNAAFGDNLAQYYEHYRLYGKAEGRTAKAQEYYSMVFNAQNYLNRYGDLRNAFGDNTTAAYIHFLRYGIAEGRQGSNTFDVKAYMAANKDLQAAFGADNYAAALSHYMTFGKNEGEGRVTLNAASTSFSNMNVGMYVNVFDENYYLSVNGDVRAAFGNSREAAYQHFIGFGIAEGRVSKANFDVKAYKQYNKDLQAAFGNDFASYVHHYIYFGINENRKANI